MSLSERQEVRIFNAAIDLSEAERVRYLDEACAGDLVLRQKVQALLLASNEADDYFKTAVDFKSQVEDLATAVVPVMEKVGDTIGRYKLLQKIGEGGCGVVYMAEQEEPVRRRVALKVIKLGMDTKQVVARFEAERQALAVMDHPNIARVFDAGATETGRPYFVMELVKGVRITEFCDQSQLPTAARLSLFVQVCAAVQHAHQKGIIHRDIKPSNILITLHDGVPVPKVIDFGIAKAIPQLRDRLTDKTLFTAFEQFIGTPAYMSPEQAEMSGLDIDTRSDIYSLGVVLYELLTGKTPFDAKELWEAGIEAMRRTIREKEPLRPSTRLETMVAVELTAAAKLRQAEPPRLIHLVRGDLDWIVMKALEKDRTRRYENANGLAQDIQRHLGNEPVFARPPSAMYRLQKLARRNKLAVASSLAVFAALVLGVSVSSWQAIRASRESRFSRRAEARAQIETARADTKALEAEKANQTALSRLARISVTDGLRRMEDGDYFGALRPLVDAWRIEGVAGTNALTHQRRLAALWQQCPRLVNFTILPEGAGSPTLVVFSPDGKRFITVESDDMQQGVFLREAGTGRQIGEVDRSLQGERVFWSGDSQRFAIESDSGRKYRIYQADNLQPVSPAIKIDACREAALDFSGGRLAIRGRTTFKMVDVISGKTMWEAGVQTTNQHGRLSVFAPDRRLIQTGPAMADLEPMGLAFGPDGRLVLMAGQAFEAASGEEWYLEPWVTNATTSVVNPNGRQALIIGGGRGNTQAWLISLSGWKDFANFPLPVVAGTEQAVFSPDGRRVATADHHGRVWICNTEDGGIVAVPITIRGGVKALHFSPDSTRLVTVSEDSDSNGNWAVRVWDATTAQAVTPNLPEPGEVLAVRFSDDGSRLFVVSTSGQLIEWDLRTSNVAQFTWPIQPGHDSASLPLAISPNGRRLAASFGGERIGVWNLDHGGQELDFLELHTWPVTLRFSPDNQRLIVGDSHCAHVWDSESGRALLPQLPNDCGREPAPGSTRLPYYHLSPMGDRLFDQDGGIFEAFTLKKILHVAPNSNLTLTAFSPDGSLALGYDSNADETFVWALTNREPLMRIKAKDNGFMTTWPDVATTPDGRWNVRIHEDGIDVWNPRTLERVSVRSTSIASGYWSGNSRLSPDGKLVLMVTGTRAWVSRSTDDKQISPMLQHRGPINSACFSPDNQLVVTASADTTVRIWDVVSGEQLASIQHPSAVAGVCFNPNGHALMTWTDRAAFYWPWDRDDRTFEDWQSLARLFDRGDDDSEAGHGGMYPHSFVKRWQELRQKRSAEFKVSETEAASWHRHQACQAGLRSAWSNELEHLTQLMQRQPASPDLHARRAKAYREQANATEGHIRTNSFQAALADYDNILSWLSTHPELAARGRKSIQSSREEVLRLLGRTEEARAVWLELHDIPPRSTTARKEMINLDPYYQRPLSTLAPAGIRRMATGVEYDLRGYVALAIAPTAQADFPQAVTAIKVDQLCRRIHLLVGSDSTNEIAGIAVARFVVHLVDGSSAIHQIKMGDDVWSFRFGKEGSKPTKNSLLAWTGPAVGDDKPGTQAHIFQSTWTNPAPAIAVKSIDFVSALNEPRPYLYAITVEP